MYDQARLRVPVPNTAAGRNSANLSAVVALRRLARRPTAATLPAGRCPSPPMTWCPPTRWWCDPPGSATAWATVPTGPLRRRGTTASCNNTSRRCNSNSRNSSRHCRLSADPPRIMVCGRAASTHSGRDTICKKTHIFHS